MAAFAAGTALLAAFAVWELRAAHPMLPLRLFAQRGFTAVNLVAMLFSFGMFGSVFFLSQFLQTVQGYTPLQAGLRVLPWTGLIMFLAPVVGKLADRVGGRVLVLAGLLLQAAGLLWLADLLGATTPYADMIPAFVLAGTGMALFFVPLASLVLGTAPASLEGVASGTNSAFRELGGVLGISVLGAVFSGSGGYRSPADYVAGLTPAILVGGIVVLCGAALALALPTVRRPTARSLQLCGSSARARRRPPRRAPLSEPGWGLGSELAAQVAVLGQPDPPAVRSLPAPALSSATRAARASASPASCAGVTSG